MAFLLLHCTCCPIHTTCVCYNECRWNPFLVQIEICARTYTFRGPQEKQRAKRERKKKKNVKWNFVARTQSSKAEMWNEWNALNVETTKRHPINAIRIVRTKAGDKFFCAKAKNESFQRLSRRRRRPPTSHQCWNRVSDARYWYDKAISAMCTQTKENNAPDTGTPPHVIPTEKKLSVRETNTIETIR